MFQKALIFCFVLFILFSCNQNKINNTLSTDSFSNYSEIIDKERYLDSLYLEASQASNDSLTREQLLKIAARYDWLKIDEKFLKTIKHAYKNAISKNDISHQAQALWYWGDYYDNKQILDSAYNYYIKAEKLYAIQKDSIQLAKMLSYKAGVLYNIGIYSESEIATAQALKILSNTNETRLKYEVSYLMTLILKDLKDYKIADKYYKDTYALLVELEKEKLGRDQLQFSWLSYYNNIGGYYNEINNLTEARKQFETALAHEAINKHPRIKAMILNNYAHNQLLLNENHILIDSLLESSLGIRKQIGHKQGITASKIRKAQFELIKKDTATAINIMTKAYKMALNNKSGYELIESLKFLSEYDTSNKEIYSAKYINTQDSLQNIQRQTRDKFARIAYETTQIERKNDILIKKNIYLVAVASIILMLSVSIFIALHLQSKNKKLKQEKREQQAIQQIQELLLKQQELTSEVKNQERLRIAKDLHDAIVNRVFTTRINLEELPSSNVILKRKLINQLKQTEAQIRTIAHDIHNNLFDQKEDFTAILKDLVLSQKNSFQTAFECPTDVSIDWSSFSIQQKTQVYLILQELLQNVNKHSQAARCFAYFLNDENKITIRIHDNGIGLDEDKVSTGMGINNIKHRLKELNGKIEFSEIREWTVVSVTFEIE